MINLPFLNKKKEDREFFLALLLKPSSIGSILFEKTQEKLVILGSSEEKIQKNVDLVTTEELVISVDKVVSAIESNLPPGAVLTNTIFSVPYHWVEEGKIKKDHLLKLKKVCEDLELTPMGFIVSVEAIVAALQQKEGVPTSSIFIEAGPGEIYLYLVKAGNIIEAHMRPLEGHMVHVVEEILRTDVARESLPPKIILFETDETKKVEHSFVSHTFPKDLGFLHVPEVAILENKFENEAIVNGVAAQMGFDVLEEVKPVTEEMPVKEIASVPEVHEEKEEELLDAQALGFLKDEDVTQVKEPEVNEKKDELLEAEQNTEQASLESEGIADSKINYHGDSTQFDQSDSLSRVPASSQDESINSNQGSRKFGLPSISLAMIKIPSIPRMSIPSFSGGFGPRIAIISVASVVLLIGFVYVYYNMILQSTVTIFTDRREFNEEPDIVFSTSEPTSLSDGRINLVAIEKQVDDEQSAPTKGVKETGEKAKGDIVLYNKTDQKKTFSKGSVLIGPNKLEFILADDVSVASTSSFSTTFSNVKGKVEASKIGKEYNIPSGTNFTIEGQSSSSYFAKNDVAFSGGSKQEVKIVSKQDMSNLEKALIDDAKKKIVQDGGESGPQAMLPVVLVSEFVKKDFSKNVNQEAESLTLAATIKLGVGGYNSEDLIKFSDELAKKEMPDSYKRLSDQSKIEVKEIEQEDEETVHAKVHISSVYAPSIDIPKVAETIKFKNEGKAIEKIKEVEGVSDVVVEFKNQIPFLPHFLPANSNRIILSVKSDG